MKKEKIENILENLLSTGGDFAEVFLEDATTKSFSYVNSNLDAYKIGFKSGVGLRLARDNSVYYGATNDLSNNGIENIVTSLKNNIKEDALITNVKLKRLKKYKNSNNTHYSNSELKEKFNDLDKLIRSKDKRINQVNIILNNTIQKVTIARESGLYVSDERVYSRIYITVGFKDLDKVCDITYSKGMTMSIDFLDLIDFDSVCKNLIKDGLDKLYAKPCIGGEMPVIIENGFGGVIFHEACGHAMEATSVAPGLSVLSNELNNQIANSKVSIVDDGTLPLEWGSTNIDDEGHETKSNMLIEDGVLKGFLIDELNNRKMNMKLTGSGRRESYRYAPTSRMNNTYLLPGTDTLKDMLKSIKLGLYAKSMGGGCVTPETGEFNFACNLAYMIRDGKIAECVKSASLIGTCKDILKNVEAVGDNLDLGQGYCGSISGSVPVNVGMPRIKVSKILVGGENEE